MVKMMALMAYLLGHTQATGEVPKNFELKSPAFGHMRAIPKRYTCEGSNVSVPLYWQGIPKNTRSLALVVRDPDAPGKPFYHWALFDISPEQHRLNANIHQPGAGVRPAKNSAGSEVYVGPCPPHGKHRYQFQLYALDKRLDLPVGVGLSELNAAIAKHTIAKAELTGTYQSAHSITS
jgi:Raf kinase inhibitor-like YbhB/YbcL family protein